MSRRPVKSGVIGRDYSFSHQDEPVKPTPNYWVQGVQTGYTSEMRADDPIAAAITWAKLWAITAEETSVRVTEISTGNQVTLTIITEIQYRVEQ